MTAKVVGLESKKLDACLFCGGEHSSLTCLRVKELELHEDGSIAFVAYYPPEVWNPAHKRAK